MAKETIEVWRCEYDNCRHAWIAQGEEPPRRCAKCKKCNWHKTLTAKQIIRSSTWQDQLMEAVKPFLQEQVKLGIAHEILEAKRRKGEYVADTLPRQTPAIQGRCTHSQPDYEAQVMAHCGKIAGHKLSCGAWIMGAPLDP